MERVMLYSGHHELKIARECIGADSLLVLLSLFGLFAFLSLFARLGAIERKLRINRMVPPVDLPGDRRLVVTKQLPLGTVFRSLNYALFLFSITPTASLYQNLYPRPPLSTHRATTYSIFPPRSYFRRLTASKKFKLRSTVHLFSFPRTTIATLVTRSYL